MSHLGRRLTALIDGELGATERDRVYAHLVTCAACRAEANELRALKKRMWGLPDLAAGDDLTQRLIEIPGPGAPAPLPGRRVNRRRGRYVALGVASCVLAGLGVTAFTVGGSPPAPGPRVTPPIEMYSAEHAITTGEVPVGGPAVVPVPALSSSSPAP